MTLTKRLFRCILKLGDIYDISFHLWLGCLVYFCPLSVTYAQNQASTVNNTNLPGTSVVNIATQNQQSQQIKSLLNGKPTISGTPTFANGLKCKNTSGSCITFNNGTTLNSVPTTISPPWVLVSSQDVVNATTVTFGTSQGVIFASSTTYWFHYALINSSAAATSNCYLFFNNDPTANYNLAYAASNNNTAGFVPDTYQANATGVLLDNTDTGGYAISNGGNASGNAYFESNYGSSTNTVMVTNITGMNNASNAASALSTFSGTAKYVGGAALSSMQITCGSNFASAAHKVDRTVIGHFELWLGVTHI